MKIMVDKKPKACNECLFFRVEMLDAHSFQKFRQRFYCAVSNEHIENILWKVPNSCPLMEVSNDRD